MPETPRDPGSHQLPLAGRPDGQAGVPRSEPVGAAALEAGLGLPRRTAPQSPLADGPAPRREKDPPRTVGSDAAGATERPLTPRPPADRPVRERPPLERPHDRPADQPAVAQQADWTLAPPEPSSAWTRTAAVCVMLGLAATGGFLLWKNYAPLLTGTPAETDVVADGIDDEEDESSIEQDPLEVAARFDSSKNDDEDDEDDELVARLPTRRSSRAAADDDDAFPIEQDLLEEESRAAAAPAVRTADLKHSRAALATRPPAVPTRPAAARTVSHVDFDELSGIDELDADDASPAQTEPDDSEESEYVELDLPPRRTSGSPREPRLASTQTAPRNADLEGDELDDAMERFDEVPREIPELRTARRDFDAAEEEVPNLRLSARPRHAPAHDARVELAAPHRNHVAAAVPVNFDDDVGEPVEDVDSDEINGLEAVDLSERRALSKTRVLRPTHVPEEMIAADDQDATHSVRSPHESTVQSGRTPITPRRSTAPVSTAKSHDSTRHFAEHPPARQASPHAADSYVVEHNDTYWSISKKLYGTARYFQALAEHNRTIVPEPERLRPGVKIAVPSEAELTAQYARYIPAGGRTDRGAPDGGGDRKHEDSFSVASDSPVRRPSERAPRGGDDDHSAAGFHYSRSGEPMYRVAEGDTLSNIAQNHLGKSSRSDELYELNQDRLTDPNRLRIGTVIRLPADASRIGLVPKSERIR